MGCIPEVVNQMGAFLYDAPMNDSLLDSMKRAISSRDELGEMGRNNFQMAKVFDWRDIAMSTSEVYSSVLDS
jgi:hypothetical protein